MKVLISMTEPFIVRSLLKEHIRYLVDHGFKVIVMCSQGEDIKWITDQGASTSIVDIKRKPSVLKDLKCLMQMIFAIYKIKPNIVHYSTPKSSLLTPLAVFLCPIKVKSIYTVRGRVYENSKGLKRKIYQLIEKFSCWMADRVIFISKEIKDSFIAESLLTNKKAKLIGCGSSNGFNTNIFRKPTSEEIKSSKDFFGLDKQSKVLIYAGRLAYDKGLEDLLIVFKELSSIDKAINLLVIGKAEVNLNSLLHKYDIDQERLVVKEWSSEIHKAYWAADVTVFPSYREGFGNVCVESILCGVPVVCYDVIGCRESVNDGVSGYLVPFRDTNLMSHKVLSLLNNTELRKTIVNTGSSWAKSNFNQEFIWNEIVKIYKE